MNNSLGHLSVQDLPRRRAVQAHSPVPDAQRGREGSREHSRQLERAVACKVEWVATTPLGRSQFDCYPADDRLSLRIEAAPAQATNAVQNQYRFGFLADFDGETAGCKVVASEGIDLDLRSPHGDPIEIEAAFVVREARDRVAPDATHVERNAGDARRNGAARFEHLAGDGPRAAQRHVEDERRPLSDQIAGARRAESTVPGVGTHNDKTLGNAIDEVRPGCVRDGGGGVGPRTEFHARPGRGHAVARDDATHRADALRGKSHVDGLALLVDRSGRDARAA